MRSKTFTIEITEEELKYLLEYLAKDIAFWRKRKVEKYERRASNLYQKIQKQVKAQLVKSLFSISLLFAFAFGGEKAHQTTPHHPPQVDISATDYIALYECRDGKLKLVWYSEDLEEEEVKELKKEEGKPCKR